MTKPKRRPNREEFKEILMQAWELKTRLEWFGLTGMAMESMLADYTKENRDFMQTSGMEATAALLRRAAHV